MENWRDVPGYEGKYQVSISTKEGKCRSLHFMGTGKITELKNNPNNKDRRIYWNLSKNGKATRQQAAVWIALTYPELVQNAWFPGACIDHIDGDRLNNHPSNLRWATYYENTHNPVSSKRRSDAFRKRRLSEETKRKISKSHIGISHPISQETRMKISKSLKAGRYAHKHPNAFSSTSSTPAPPSPACN